MSPKVFISHASEDKARFVIPFSIALRERGVDAWVDRWEMLPGDSLVDKIFEEGLKEASAVVIVLSAASVAKPWVREELNAAVVARIEKGTRLIPIVLDDCEVPQSLRSTVWETVDDVSNFNGCLERVLDAVLARETKPEIGSPPDRHLAQSVPGLAAADVAILAVLCEVFIEKGRIAVDPSIVIDAANEQGIDVGMVSESMEILRIEGLAELFKHNGRGPYSSRITRFGVAAMLGDEEDGLLREVALRVVNEGLTRADAIAASTGRPLTLVEHAFRRLEDAGHLTATDFMSDPNKVASVSPTLRRWLRAQ